MFYFARPFLAGNNVARTQFATVRGSVRRSDPDGISPLPYFPGVTVAPPSTLIFTIDTTPYTVTFTGNDLYTVISDINTAIGLAGYASDSDGCLSITSNTPGGNGVVAVTGGTAFEALGFAYAAGLGTMVAATGGDIPRSPEGRNGNNPYTTFPGNRDNLTASALQRALTSVAGNVDVLHAEAARHLPLIKKATLTSSANGTYLPMSPASTRVFTGKNLSMASTKEELSAYFTIIDTVTKQPTASRVVGVVQGPPVTVPPSANTAGWRALDGGNVLGQDILKVSAVTIDEIHNGRFVVCSGATFVTSGVQIGDYASIAGATNFTPRNHNGYSWVVETILSETKLQLRPMSASELASIGSTPNAGVDPLLELNDFTNLGEVYGDLSIRTGIACSEVNLVVDPPLPPSTSFEVWYPDMGAAFSTSADILGDQLSPISRLPASDLDTEPNGILSQPTISGVGTGSLSVGAFYVRWHGRVIYVPAQVLTAPVGTEETVVYWEESTNSLVLYTLASPPGTYVPTTIFNGLDSRDPSLSASSSGGFQIAKLDVSVGSITAATLTALVLDGNSSLITVGYGGQFKTLKSAAEYLYTLSKANSESLSANGVYSHAEIVLLSDQAFSSYVQFALPHVTIRGATPDIKLRSTTGFVSEIIRNTVGGVTLADLTIECATHHQTLVYCTNAVATSKVTLRNLKMSSASVTLLDAVITTGSQDVVIEDCQLNVCQHIVSGALARYIHVLRSYLYCIYDGFSNQAFACTSWMGLSVDKSQIVGFLDNSSGVLFQESPATDFVSLTDSLLDGGGQTPTADSWLFSATNATVKVNNCKIFMTGNAGVCKGTGANVSISGCSIVTNAFSSTTPAFAATKFHHNSVAIATDTPAKSNQTLFNGVVDLESNSFSGTQLAYPIKVDVGSRIVQNSFELSASANFPLSSDIIQLNGTDVLIEGNKISTESISCDRVIAVFADRCCVLNNVVAMNYQTSASTTGIYAPSTTSTVISGNSVTISGGTPTGLFTGIDVTGATSAHIIGNTVSISGSAAVVNYGLKVGTSNLVRIESNDVSAYGYPLYVTTTYSNAVICNNRFEQTKSGGTTDRLSGTVIGNVFTFSGAAVDHPAVLGPGSFSENTFDAVSFSFSAGELASTNIIIFSNNKVASTFTMNMSTGYPSVNMSGCTVLGTSTFSNGVGSIVKIDGCQLNNLSLTGTTSQYFVSGSSVGTLSGTLSSTANLTLASSVVATLSLTCVNLVMSGCRATNGPHTLSGSSLGSLRIDGGYIYGNVTATSNFAKTLVAGVHFEAGGGGTVNFSSTESYLSACRFDGISTVQCATVFGSQFSAASVTLNVAEINGCTALSVSTAAEVVRENTMAGLTFLDTGYPRILLEGNKFRSTYTTGALVQFQNYTFGAGMKITILNNEFRIGNNTNPVQGYCLYFASSAQNVNIVGNKFEFEDSGTDPLNSGTYTFGMIHCDGTPSGWSSTLWNITGNMFTRGASSGWSFRTGALSITYKFFYAATISQVIWSGNMMISNTALHAASVPYNGDWALDAGSTPYSK